MTDSASDTLEAFGRIDVVVNSAGVMPRGPIADGKLEDFDRVIATSLRGTFIVLGQTAKHVSRGGRIIALSSSVVAKSLPGCGAYIASKAGVEGLVRVLASELLAGPDGGWIDAQVLRANGGFA